MMIGFGISAENFLISGTFFIATSFASSGSQKKEYSEVDFGCVDAVTFIGEVTSFFSSTSGLQKKDRSETSFIRRGTGNVETFI